MADFNAASSTPPTLEWLDSEGADAVHDASMRIVEELGIQLGDEEARALVAANGGTVDDDGIARLPRDVVLDAVSLAPSSFTLHARNPDHDVTVGGDGPPVRAPSYGPSRVRTFEDGRRDATLSDYETLVKLAHAEDVITCSGYNLCEPTDVDQHHRHLAMLERSLTLSDKPVMGPTHGRERAQACMDMVGVALDDPDLSRPVVAGLINTVPPRRIDAEMLGGLLTYAEHGQPLVVSSFTMAGASGPPSLAASLAQANAENLVGIALAQFANPGTPVVYGVPSAVVDDRYGSLSIGSPESALFASFAAQMARRYDLPSRGGGSLSDAKTVDYQSGFESALVGATTSFSGVDFALNAAGVLESYSTVSPEKFVLDCEALRSLEYLRSGVPVDGDAISLDRIADTDPAGHFLDDCGPAAGRPPFQSAVLDKQSHDDWVEDGQRSAFELGRDRVQGLLEDYERPPMDDSTADALDRYVTTHVA